MLISEQAIHCQECKDLSFCDAYLYVEICVIIVEHATYMYVGGVRTQP